MRLQFEKSSGWPFHPGRPSKRWHWWYSTLTNPSRCLNCVRVRLYPVRHNAGVVNNSCTQGGCNSSVFTAVVVHVETDFYLLTYHRVVLVHQIEHHVLKSFVICRWVLTIPIKVKWSVPVRESHKCSQVPRFARGKLPFSWSLLWWLSRRLFSLACCLCKTLVKLRPKQMFGKWKNISDKTWEPYR